MTRRSPSYFLVLAVLAQATVSATAQPADTKAVNDKVKEVAGTSEFLRAVPKRFATLKGVDTANHRVTLLVDGEGLPKVWGLAADAEVKRDGWWARLEQFQPGERVWVWFQLDRAKQPRAISMLADEMTEQDIHAAGLTLEARDGDNLKLKFGPDKTRVHKAGGAEVRRGSAAASLDALPVGSKVYVRSDGDRARLVLDAEAFETRRAEQKAWLRKRWLEEGLPATVSFLHQFGGEMDLILDHEAMRWGRSLKTGDKVTLPGSPPIPAVVKQVRPWRERTLLRLVVNSFDQSDLVTGQRLRMRMEAPSAEVEDSPLPPDLDRPRARDERVEWFLASVYCTCKVKGDGCTGHFYTLASCNVNACGMPNAMRRVVGEMIDRGMSDRQIFEDLMKDHGPDLLRPHLLP